MSNVAHMLLTREQMVGIEEHYPEILDPVFFEIARQVSTHTISDIAAQWGFYKAIEYVVKHKIPGDIVECGVWNGGSILLASYALQHFGDTSRKLYLYDTFAGMPQPDEVDVDCYGDSALEMYNEYKEQGHSWGYGGTQPMVQEVVYRSGYPRENYVFVEGLVEDTMESTLPEQISILRLDTDLYASTYHELVVGYPKLSKGGVLIVDDYGQFLGSRKATDQYIAEHNLPLLLTRINTGVHITVKP